MALVFSLPLSSFKLRVRTTYMTDLGDRTFMPYVVNKAEQRMINAGETIRFYYITNEYFAYIYVPKYVTVTLTSSTRAGSVTFRGEAIISAQDLFWSDGSVFNSSATVIVNWVYNTNLFTLNQWNGYHLLTCQGKETFNILGTEVNAFTPQSGACDLAMTEFCNVSGRTPSTNPECSCILNDNLLYNVDGTDIHLNVTCFNQGCYKDGYKTGPMSQQTCSATQCEAVSSTDLVQQDVYCAGSYYSNATENSDQPDASIGSTSDTPTTFVRKVYVADTYIWIGSAVMLLVSLILLYFFVSRSRAK